MATKTTPAPRRAGTRQDIPQWLEKQLRRDPELLRVVANVVRKHRARSARARAIRLP